MVFAQTAAFAALFNAFGPEDFVRERGQPVVVTRQFPAQDLTASYRLRIENGGSGARFQRVSGAVVTLNGVVVAGPNDFNQNVQIIEKSVALAARNTLSVELRSSLGSGFTLSILGESTQLSLRITDPVPEFVTREDSIDVAGTFTGAATAIAVNGVNAVLGGSTFTARVPLAEGTNRIVAIASGAGGVSASDSVLGRRDTDPPLVVIETPRDGERLISQTVTIAGTVNDIIPGATVNSDDVTVTVNGQPAAVNNRTFTFPDLPLALGPNTVTATAVDRAGNSRTTSIEVSREPDLAGIRIEITGGNNQRGPINSLLPQPLAVSVRSEAGVPLAGRPVQFEVSNGDGLLADANANLRRITLLTDASGGASVPFSLGSRTGEGFHRIRVTTPGSLTFAELCATAEPTAPATLSVTLRPPVRSAAGQRMADPLAVIVTDQGGNPVPGVPVTFRVDLGGGGFDGEESVTVPTNPDGVAQATWTLGPDPGVANNEASANFEGNLGFPAVFLVSGLASDPAGETRVSGIVQNSIGGPIIGAKVEIRASSLEAFTGPDGRFTITGVPPGEQRVAILGSTANDPARGVFFPHIDFAVQMVQGVENELDQIVVLPFLDMANAKLVGGGEDVVLGMDGVPGFGIKVFAHSAILPDGTRGEVLMSSSQVKFDKVPMPPPRGSTAFIVGTLQPGGIRFDPPAQVIYPNIEGLAPGDVADIYAFHHDIGQFVNVGPGTVSEDASVIASDPGFGIVESGWHCLIRIPGPTSNCANGCSARLEWQSVKADGSLGPVSSTGPVLINNSNNDLKKAKIKVAFSPGGGMFDSQAWSGGQPVVTRSEESATGTTAKVTVEATGTPGTAAVTTPIYRIKVPSQADKTCQAEVEVAPAKIEFLNASSAKTEFANVANWETAFDPGPTARQNFHTTDVDRFLVRIEDPTRKGDASIRATIRTFDSANDTADRVENFELTAMPPGSGIFRSMPKVLVSNAVDDTFQAANVADGNAADPTLNVFQPGKLTSNPLSIRVSGRVRVDYNPSTGAGTTGAADGEARAEATVCESGKVETVTVRPFILRETAGGTATTTEDEVKEDFALTNVAWAQCCVSIVGSVIQVVDPPAAEPFQNTGFDHDGNPATPLINPSAGFDFDDTNMNLLHDAGERSEPFTDSNSNGGYDFGVNLADGSLDEFPTAGPQSGVPTREERSLIDTLADNDAKTVDYFVVNLLSMGSRGEAFIPSAPEQVNNLKTVNVMIVRQASVGIAGTTPRDFVNAPHELGHILLDAGGHTSRSTTAGRVNIMVGGGTDAADGVNNSKRLTDAQCTTARSF